MPSVVCSGDGDSGEPLAPVSGRRDDDALASFTQSWTHSIEKVVGQED